MKEENEWEERIDQLSDLFIKIRECEHIRPNLAYEDAYQKMMEACEEFVTAHFG